MVYHGFKGDKDVDEILRDKENKSGFIKQAIKAYVPQQTPQTKPISTAKNVRLVA